MVNKIKLSVVILNYNTKELVLKCLQSLEKVKKEVNFEVIVVDNASEDGSRAVLRKYQDSTKAKAAKIVKFQLIETPKNLGFAAGNNVAQKHCRGEYVLFLNTDTEIHAKTLKKCTQYLEEHKGVGAMTCKMLLPSGKLDKDTRRAFPTPWVAFTHLILNLDRIFPKSKIFARYWYGYLDENQTHEVDVIEGAFFLVRKKILDEMGWFDETYFLDGENVDLCYRIKKAGWKIIYYPEVTILHYKGVTKGKVASKTRKNVPLEDRLKFRMAGVDSMEIFYRKYYWKKYPLLLNFLIILGIRWIKLLRYIRTVLLG